MTGWLFNTLSYRLRRELHDWRKANTTLQENSWPWYQRMLITAGKRPVHYPLEVLTVVIMISAVLWGVHVLAALCLGDTMEFDSGFKDYFFTLWTIQASIAAMIYPIVIGFVSLLLQRRYSAKASLHIYLHDSAAILTGLSALFLVAAMAIQFFFLSTVCDVVLSDWLIIDGLWFLANIMGVIWFLARTFDYLRPERRASIIRKYAINHVFPAELERNLQQYHLFLGAIYYGWLPGPVYGDDSSNANTSVLPGSLGRGMGAIQVTRKVKGKLITADVRFRLLSLAVRSWQWRKERLALGEKECPATFPELHRSPLLILPLVPGDVFEEKVGLCRMDGDSGLRWWEHWLIQRAFLLSPDTGKDNSLTISDIICDLITEVKVAMETGEEVVFRESLHELVDVHGVFILLGAFTNDNGKQDNYVFLVDRSSAFDNKMHDMWAREYRRLYEIAVDRLFVNDSYFKSIAHITGWLIGRLGEVRPVTISVNLLQLPRYLHYRLNRWWSKTAEEQGLMDHGPCESSTLNAPAFSTYDSAIKAFVGSWESLKNNRFPPGSDKPLAWDGYIDITELYTEHLDGTLNMLFDSLSLGNKEGAEWLSDSLMKWWNTVLFRFDNTYYYIRDERRLTLELLRKPWDEARDVIDLSMAGNSEENAPKSIWAACIHNYWVDLRCVSIYAMLQLGKDCECDHSLPAKLAVALTLNQHLRAGSESMSDQWSIRSVEDLLMVIIRQYYFDGGYHSGYRARLDKVVEALSSMGKPSMVPGRIYSGWGLEDLDALSDGQLLWICLFVRDGWTPSAGFMEVIQSWGVRNDDALRVFVEKLEQWKTRLADVEFLSYEGLFDCIKTEFGAIKNYQEAIEEVEKGIDHLLKGIGGFRTQKLREAKVSEARLRDVAMWCSKTGFQRDSADIPVSLFREVQFSPEVYTEHSLIIRDMNKGEFVDPPMAQRVGNEDEWFDQTVSSHVAATVMADVLRSLDCETVDVDSPLSYWQQIESNALRISKNGGEPILFVAGRGDPRWLLDWARSAYDERVERPEGLQLVRDKQFDMDGYVGSLNNIPVFVAPVSSGSSYLMPQDLMDVLTFTKFDDGVFVKVSHEPVESNDVMINLRLTWCYDLELKETECWRIKYLHLEDS